MTFIGGRLPNHSVGLPYRLGGRGSRLGEEAAALQEVQQDTFAVEAQVGWKVAHHDGLAAFAIPGFVL